jgi:hypothetical protein
MFGPAAEDKNSTQNAELKKQIKFKSQSNFPHEKPTDSQVTFLGINGNVVKPESETRKR